LAILARSSACAVDADLLAVEVGQPHQGTARRVIDHAGTERGEAYHALRLDHFEDYFLHLRIVNRRSNVRLVAEQHRRAEDTVARLKADIEVDRTDIALDGAELYAFDLAWDRSELARRINLHLDAAAGSLLQRIFVELDVLVLGLVDGRGTEFHDVFGRRSRSNGVPVSRHDNSRSCQGDTMR